METESFLDNLPVVEDAETEEPVVEPESVKLGEEDAEESNTLDDDVSKPVAIHVQSRQPFVAHNMGDIRVQESFVAEFVSIDNVEKENGSTDKEEETELIEEINEDPSEYDATEDAKGEEEIIATESVSVKQAPVMAEFVLVPSVEPPVVADEDIVAENTEDVAVKEQELEQEVIKSTPTLVVRAPEPVFEPESKRESEQEVVLETKSELAPEIIEEVATESVEELHSVEPEPDTVINNVVQEEPIEEVVRVENYVASDEDQERVDGGKNEFWWNPKRWISIMIIGGVILAGGTGYFFLDLGRVDSSAVISAAGGGQLSERELLLKTISELVVLPAGEEPTVATVVDLEPLRDQDFFENAEIGFKVLIYTGAKKAYLYDPVSNRVVNVAPVILEDTSVDGEDLQQGLEGSTLPLETENVSGSISPTSAE